LGGAKLLSPTLWQNLKIANRVRERHRVAEDLLGVSQSETFVGHRLSLINSNINQSWLCYSVHIQRKIMKNRIDFRLLAMSLVLLTMLVMFQNCANNTALSLEKVETSGGANEVTDANSVSDTGESFTDDSSDTTAPDSGTVDEIVGPAPVISPNPTALPSSTELPTSTPSPTATPTATVVPVVEAMERCKEAVVNNTLRKDTVEVNFPTPSISEVNGQYRCSWKNDSELWNEHYTSYSEQNVSFSIPAGAKLCDMKFIVEKQSFKYDDHFVFSFDGFILASNSMGLMSYLPDSTSFKLNDMTLNAKLFKWEYLLNKQWGDYGDQLSNFYCFAKDVPGVSCSWPITDTEGTISMEYPQGVLLQMANQISNATTHEFSFRTTGDNDKSSDCSHSPLKFQIEVSYAP
jgi:hypothetical protein